MTFIFPAPKDHPRLRGEWRVEAQDVVRARQIVQHVTEGRWPTDVIHVYATGTRELAEAFPNVIRIVE